MIQARNVATSSLFQKEQIAARWKNHRNRPAQTAFWQKTVTTRHVILLQQLLTSSPAKSRGIPAALTQGWLRRPRYPSSP